MGVVRKKVACQIPTSRCTAPHTARGQAKTQKWCTRTRATAGRTVADGRPSSRGGRLRHTLRQALTKLVVGLQAQPGQSTWTVAQPPNFAKRNRICRAQLQWAALCPQQSEPQLLGLCPASSTAQAGGSELAPTARPPQARQTTTARADAKKDLDLRPSSTTTQPTPPTNARSLPTTPNRQPRRADSFNCAQHV